MKVTGTLFLRAMANVKVELATSNATDFVSNSGTLQRYAFSNVSVNNMRNVVGGTATGTACNLTVTNMTETNHLPTCPAARVSPPPRTPAVLWRPMWETSGSILRPPPRFDKPVVMSRHAHLGSFLIMYPSVLLPVVKPP